MRFFANKPPTVRPVIQTPEEELIMSMTEETTTEQTENTQPVQIDRNGRRNDGLADDISALIRASLTQQQKDAMLFLAERILEKVVEEEVREALAPRFEAMYEGVVANVMQRLLMQALTERANSTLTQLTKG